MISHRDGREVIVCDYCFAVHEREHSMYRQGILKHACSNACLNELLDAPDQSKSTPNEVNVRQAREGLGQMRVRSTELRAAA